MFVINHLLGDPVDTLKNLLIKMSDCQKLAQYWEKEHEAVLGISSNDMVDRDWKALAIITDAYAECGEGDLAKETL